VILIIELIILRATKKPLNGSIFNICEELYQNYAHFTKSNLEEMVINDLQGQNCVL